MQLVCVKFAQSCKYTQMMYASSRSNPTMFSPNLNLLKLLGLDLGLSWPAQIHNRSTPIQKDTEIIRIFRVKYPELELMLSARLQWCQFSIISHQYWPDKGQHQWSQTFMVNYFILFTSSVLAQGWQPNSIKCPSYDATRMVLSIISDLTCMSCEFSF